MDDTDYRLIADLYELKNITRAAEKHFMSQPAVTKRIKRIEEELGAELMLRGRYGVVFTEFGESIAPHCRAIAQRRERLLCALNEARGTVAGSLNVISTTYYSHYRLPDALSTYTRLYPGVNLSISTAKSDSVYRQSSRREDCVGILRGEYAWDETKLLLSSEPMCLVCSRENAHRPLNGYSYITHNTDGATLARAEQWAAEHDLSLMNSPFHVDDIHACKEMALRGIGWSILPAICLDSFEGEVQELSFADGSPFVRNTYAICRNAYAQLRQVKLFLDVLAAL